MQILMYIISTEAILMNTQNMFLWRIEENYPLSSNIPLISSLPFDLFITVKLLNIRTPEKVAVITLKFEHSGFTIEWCIQKMERELQTV